MILEISFVKGINIEDKYNLFQDKNKETKSIIIINTKQEFLDQLKYYIDSVIERAKDL